eukprot:COSAG06_NODE_30139_length_544_cov_0.651685_1_plen_148_part_01
MGRGSAAAAAAPPVEVSCEDLGSPTCIEEACARHGLTARDLVKIRTQGVTEMADFAALSDHDFELSGIDIKERRATKLRDDCVAQAIAHAPALARQVQALLDEAGLSPAGREALRGAQGLESVDALRLPRYPLSYPHADASCTSLDCV